jgi:hypothetical protein
VNTFDETVAQHLAALHGADRENAYHRLIELGPGVIPLVTTRFQQERDPIMRSTLVNIAWRAHASSAVPLLQEAVEDAEPRIWKEALDGLVAVGGSDALDAMRQARERAKGEKAAWLDEAIDQIRA